MLADISVIIPAYNRAELIGETLRTLLNQTFQAKEIIVVDDGSTDGTAEAVEREFSVFREQFSGNSKFNIQNSTFKILRQANAGPAAARNRGLAEATGEFIHFFDSDDIAAPNKHEVQLRALLETGADIAYGPWVKGHFAPVEKLKDFLTTIERQGGRENRKLGKAEGRATESWPQRGAASGTMQVKEQPQVGPKGEGVGTTESKDAKKHEKAEEVSTTDDTDIHGYQKNQLGNAQGTCAIEAFSNPSPSELARDSKNTSLTRSASGPAEEALRIDDMGSESAGGNQLADSKEFLEGQSQAGLQMDNQKDPTIRTANDSSASGEYSSSVLIRDIRGSKYSLPLNFVPEGPVLQALGLPHGDLVRALLTNWSVIPHACLFRRSILEKAGGFPEDIWVGEDQLLFLRCLLAGAKVVHTPETLVFYRLGNDPGKLTATGAAQKRHARDWARFLVKANQEVEDQKSKIKKTTKDSNLHERGETGPRLASQVGASESDSLRSGLADSPVSESPTRSATGPAEALCADDMGLESAGGNQPADSMEFLEGQSQAGLQMDNKKNNTIRSANDLLASIKQSDKNPVNLVNPVKNCFGFRLRAYEAWRDMERFFPAEEGELKNELKGIWKRNWFSGSRFQFSGFVLRKLGGLKQQLLGYRENTSFRCGRPSEVGFPPHEGQRR